MVAGAPALGRARRGPAAQGDGHRLLRQPRRPGQIFDTRPGEIFVVRNVANLAPPFETTRGLHGVSAALEFAVTQLEVEEILVMGHGSCGGCAAALTGQFDDAAHGDGHFIADWVGLLEPARDEVRKRHSERQRPGDPRDGVGVGEGIARAICAPSRGSAEREADGRLSLHGGHFSVAEGKLYMLDEAEDAFRPVN